MRIISSTLDIMRINATKERGRNQMPMGELRRFKMLGSQNAKDFGDWCDRKKLSRNDLIYILTSIALTDDFIGESTYDEVRQAYLPRGA